MKYFEIITERHVANSVDVDNYVERISDNYSPKVKKWCETVLRKYILRDLDSYGVKEMTYGNLIDYGLDDWAELVNKGQDVFKIDISRSDKDKFERVLAYLEYLVKVKPQIDLQKMSYLVAEKQQEDWQHGLNTKATITKGTKVIMKFPDGAYFVKLTNGRAIQDEGNRAHHCMRHLEHYWTDYASDDMKTSVFSLRKGNSSILTLTFKDGVLEGFSGHSNTSPSVEYRNHMIELMKKYGLQYSQEYYPYGLDFKMKNGWVESTKKNFEPHVDKSDENPFTNGKLS